MSSLYRNADIKPVYTPPIAAESFDFEPDFKALRSTIKAYFSAGNIVSTVAAESLTFVQPGNRVLFNEYAKLISTTYQVDAPKLVPAEAFESSSVVTINHQLALEGWMGDIWTKIKSFFLKISNAVKEFFKRHFTRLGIVKKRLENIQKVLNEANTEIDHNKASGKPIPSGLEAKYAGQSEVSAATVGKTVSNMKEWIDAFTSVTEGGKKLSKAGIVGPDFIRSIKELRDKAASASASIASNDKEKSKIGFVKGMHGEGKSVKNELKDANKSLSSIKKEADAEANDKEEAIDAGGEADLKSEEANASKAETDYMLFMNQTAQSLSKLTGRVFVNGFTLKEVKVDKEKGLEVDIEENKDEPKTITLAGKAQLLGLCKAAVEIIDVAEKNSAAFISVNDEVMKQLDAVDSLVKDIDKIDPEKYGKYRKVLTQQVQTRLKLLQNFFRGFNQIGKNVYNAALNTAEGTVEFATYSMKHFS